tara:strand:- start:62 stop:400 length:339 start_codon:yes stop_codon:yes gene_type:complete
MEVKFSKRVQGKALFSKKKYSKGSIIFTLEGKILDKPNKYTIEIGKDKHIIDKYGIYMNHSFTPSTKIDGKNIIALKDINIGDELHFNYNNNETCMACPFNTINGKVFGKKK